ncbi:putative RNA-directed DNA polymerase from mobile element jockey-like [Apostichopus japonicus]|uniref:Putative RNA-directed DNA polymerase from mobile element jockey-like n=1 Tax=Stichopus japonicus TaxID=307972 RepID=A0A2G8LJN3_STIJA|nr:putative RNA-directed DNA polymerase from mobile element jockey-like [Apostichopus japonicus]
MPIFLKVLDRTNKRKEPFHIRNFNRHNMSEFIDDIEKETWEEVLTKVDANSAYNSFFNTFYLTYNKCFPHLLITKGNRRKRKHPWITKGILKSIKRKNHLYRLYSKAPTNSNREIYVAYRNKLNHIIRFSKRLYFYNKFKDSNNNVNDTWGVINEVLKKDRKKSSYPSVFKDGDHETSDDQDYANGFNDFFINLGPSLASKISHTAKSNNHMYSNNSTRNSIFTYPVREEELLRVANHCLKPKKAAGYDDFKPDIVKQVLPFIVTPLTHICNISFTTGVFPDKLKIAKVLPIFKKGESNIYENYRPISILSCFSKILERLMSNRIINFLDANDILCKEQYGFRPGHSTELALADAIDKLYDSLDKKKTCIGIFLDLSKAFDTIDHRILLNKLSFYGIRGPTLNWMDSYLSKRLQYTSYKKTMSDYAEIRCGVPQGSILGPLLFIIYINDICHISNIAKTILFADDTSIFFESNNLNTLHDIVSMELNQFNDWFATNKLSLNLDKTSYIVFNKSKSFSWKKTF